MYSWGSCFSSTPPSSSCFVCKEVYENRVMRMVDVREQIRREREMERIMAAAAAEGMQRRQLGGWMGLSSSAAVADELPFQRAPRFTEMPVYPTTNDRKNDIIGKGRPCSSKRKEPPLSSRPSRAAGSIGFGLPDTTAKKLKGDQWSCDVCKISATSKNGLDEHLAGKKHQKQMAALESHLNGGTEIGLAKVKSSVKEQSVEISVIPKENRKTKGDTTKKSFKTWCKICKIKTTSERNMRKHKEGKQHLRKLLNIERTKNKTRLAGSESIGE